MARCQAFTKRKTQCTTGGATLDVKTGTWLCHVHHPDGVFCQSKPDVRKERIAKRLRMRPLVVQRSSRADHSRYAPLPDTLSLKDRY